VMPGTCPLGHAKLRGFRRLQRVPGRHAASTSVCARIRLLPHDGLPEHLQPPDTGAETPSLSSKTAPGLARGAKK
jgi:hypothetical protein